MDWKIQIFKRVNNLTPDYRGLFYFTFYILIDCADLKNYKNPRLQHAASNMYDDVGAIN